MSVYIQTGKSHNDPDKLKFDQFARHISFDYMGSSEFEGSTIRNVRHFIMTHLNEYQLTKVSLSHDEGTAEVLLFCHTGDKVRMQEQIQSLFSDPKGEHDLLESIHFRSSILGTEKQFQSMNHDFWLDIGEPWGSIHYPKLRYTDNYPCFFSHNHLLMKKVILSITRLLFPFNGLINVEEETAPKKVLYLNNKGVIREGSVVSMSLKDNIPYFKIKDHKFKKSFIYYDLYPYNEKNSLIVESLKSLLTID